MQSELDGVVAFGPFEWDWATGELRKNGGRVRLAGQPAEILKLLLVAPGRLVTREDLRRSLWGEDTFVDFEQGLNTAVARLRQALGDSAEAPRYVETVPGRGYRFVGTIRDRPGESKTASEPQQRIDRRAWLAGGLGAMAGATAGYFLRSLSFRATTEPNRGRFVLSAPPAPPLRPSPFLDIAIAPDGNRVVYACSRSGSPGLYLRPIHETEGRFLPGNDVFNPFFSPDGMEIGFYRFPDQSLVRASSLGGASSAVATGIGVLNGASWSPRGDIVFGIRFPSAGLMRVSSSGGEPEPVTVPVPGESHGLPEVLPGGEAALFTVLPAELDSAAPQIAIADLGTGEYRALLPGSCPRYAPTGHLLFVLDDRLMVVKFDADRQVYVGAPTTILRNIVTSARGVAQYGFSQTGSLVLVREASAEARELVWVDRTGKEEAIGAPSRGYTYPRISPDGRRVAVNARDARGNDIFLWDPAREGMTRLTSASNVGIYPTWSPDGKLIAFWSGRPPTAGLFLKSVDGSSEAELWSEADALRAVYFFSPSGRELIVARQSSGGVQLCKVAEGGDEVVLLEDARNAVLSANGRRIAYQSDAGGRFEIYVRSFPSVDAGYHQVSSGGGIQPAWSPSGAELFYIEPGPPPRLMSAPVESDPSSAPGRPVAIMDWPYFTGELGRTYDVSRPEGERFLVVKQTIETGLASAGPRVEIVLDWLTELEQQMREPGTRSSLRL